MNRRCASCAHLRPFARPFEQHGAVRIGACAALERIVGAHFGALCSRYSQKELQFEDLLDALGEAD